MANYTATTGECRLDASCQIFTETQHIELKAAEMGCSSHLYDTLSSFANQEDGGTIVFGIDEKSSFKVVGVYDAQDLQQKVAEQCKTLESVLCSLWRILTGKL